jgi:hypothetical protein
VVFKVDIAISDNHCGRGPVREFALRSRLVRVVKLLSSVGMEPVSALLLRSTLVRVVKLPSSEGIVPTRLLDARFKPVTASPVHVTPYQSHSVPGSPAQPVVFVQLIPGEFKLIKKLEIDCDWDFDTMSHPIKS